MSGPVAITLWTDPACPFAFSAEPVRMRMRTRWQCEPPESVAALLASAQGPLATAEVTEIMRRAEPELRDELRRCAVTSPAGADMCWHLP